MQATGGSKQRTVESRSEKRHGEKNQIFFCALGALCSQPPRLPAKPVKVRSRELVAHPCSYTRRLFEATQEVKARK